MMKPFVDARWLAQHRAEVVLVDVRWYLDGRSGREEFELAHAPGAVYVDLREWLAGPASSSEGRHPLPDPSVFARGMSSCGISDDSVVVAYDDVGGVIAARLVWMLRVTGHDAALLDGGLSVFVDELETGPGLRMSAGSFRASPWPADRLATIEDAINPSLVVLDARNRDRYEGAPDTLDPRFGHIPGARSVPCRENIDAEGHLKPESEVRAAFASAGVRDGDGVVAYCGSGVTACHNLLAMESVGLGLGRLFVGSWSQYSRDATRPLATSATPDAGGQLTN